jgi:hypothetical protein
MGEAGAVGFLESRQVAEISAELRAGEYRLIVEFGSSTNSWPIWVVPTPTWPDLQVRDALGLFGDLKSSESGPILATAVAELTDDQGVLCLTSEGTLPRPFWRESAYTFEGDLWASLPFAERWSRLLPVSGDCALDPAWLAERFGSFEVFMRRIDTRTYEELPVVVRAGGLLITTLRPFGGLGCQPTSLARNPAGCALLQGLIAASQ